MSTRPRHLHGRWPHRCYAHQSCTLGTFCGCCRSSMGLDGAARHLDHQHHPDFLRLKHPGTLGGQWYVPDWIMFLEFGSMAAASVIIVFRRFTRPAAAA